MIETGRLTVRLPAAGDVPNIVRYYRDNRAHLQPWSPTFQPELFDEAVWNDQVKIRADEFAAGHGFRAFVFTRDGPSAVVGNLNLTQVSRGWHQSCVLGYNLAESAQGRGYMTEAVRGAVEFAFRNLGLHRVTANYMPHNVRSASVLKRCGFTVEGYARDFLMINGRWEDHILTAIYNPGA